jgi:serine protease Do
MIVVHRSLIAWGAIVVGFCRASPVAAQSLQTLPGLADQDGASAVTGNAVSPSPIGGQGRSPERIYERVRRGVVTLVRNGVPVAVGTALANDGRILTALSGLSGLEEADVRYADGTVVHARLGRSDRALDLALLVPEPNRWPDGLKASEFDPSGLDVRAILPVRGAQLGSAPATLSGWANAFAPGGKRLFQMLAVNIQGPLAGAPLLDIAGDVVAVLVRACKGESEEPPDIASSRSPNANVGALECQPIVVGAPVSSIRSFLTPSKAPSKAAGAPWVGVRVEPVSSGNVRGVRVVAVAPASPADRAGLWASTDVIAAVDGHPVGTSEALAEAIAQHVPGDTVKLLVFRAGQFLELPVVLRAAL